MKSGKKNKPLKKKSNLNAERISFVTDVWSDAKFAGFLGIELNIKFSAGRK